MNAFVGPVQDHQRYDGPALFLSADSGNISVRLTPGLRIGLDEGGGLKLGTSQESDCIEFFINETNDLAMRALGAFKMIARGRETVEVPLVGSCYVDLGAARFLVSPSLAQLTIEAGPET